VKITTGDAPTLPLDFVETILPPQPCLSEALKIGPIDSALFPTVLDEENSTPMLTSPDEDTEEFGEFLLDAVDWL
jgi:hypothetical protein